MPTLKSLNYPHIAGMVFDTPLFATKNLSDSIKSVLVPRLLGKASVDPLQLPAQENNFLEISQETGANAESVEQFAGMVIAAGVAVIPIHGILVSRRGTLDNTCEELTSYERIRSNLRIALRRDDVKEIVMDMNSGGGMCAGCKELADYIFKNRDKKPITAIVNYHAYSACYFLAAACSQIIVSNTSGLGSIGVIMEHMEQSRWNDEIGLTVTTLFRGGHKNDGSIHEPLTEQAQAEINHMLDRAYSMFTESVAEYRGLDVAAVIATEAKMYGAQQAIDAGLADAMMDPTDALDAIVAKHASLPPTQNRSIRAQAELSAQKMKL